MMRAQLDDCRRRGEPLAALWASEDVIYGRFGYGLASLTGEIAIPRDRSRYAAPFEPFGATRLVPRGEAEKLVAPIWETVAKPPALFSRSSDLAGVGFFFFFFFFFPATRHLAVTDLIHSPRFLRRRRFFFFFFFFFFFCLWCRF